ncbi:S-layer-like y domain-containing protein [Sulfidibacter corallicola]|uniref:S-layer homology domain-containing protein n=1 Tax=Sulfidibacter corallicola TaxID=2818388 RepID=A0A8A4TTP6_SULCO|nr:S-layer homology domain-containing protein [Sulfidibacter corallicola]QTD52514.1 S-layer homology domain-containing protein [Sulfidibacter corallicola]
MNQVWILLFWAMAPCGDRLDFPNASVTNEGGSEGSGYLYTTLEHTRSSTDSLVNNWPDETGYADHLRTHYLYSPEDYWFDKGDAEDPFKPTGTGLPLGARIPIVLVHGWQGKPGSANPMAQIHDVDSAASYWANLLKFFDKLDPYRIHFKVFLYRYPTYKHVTYNASILKHFLDWPGSTDNELRRFFKRVDEPSFDDKAIFIGHSMGTIVLRSAFEEHDLPTQYADKILLLSGVHHGSPAAVPNWVGGNTVFKDLYTFGANDLQWDNYDGILGSRHLMETFGEEYPRDVLRIIAWTFPGIVHASEARNLDHLFDEIQDRTVTEVRIPETDCFDHYYRKELERVLRREDVVLPVVDVFGDTGEPWNIVLRYYYNVLGPNRTQTYALPVLLNPWLTRVNMLYQYKMSESYKRKLYFFGGINANGGRPGNQGDGTKNNNISDVWNNLAFGIAEDGVQELGPVRMGYGYLNDGPSPVTSQLFNLRYSYDSMIVPSAPPEGTKSVTMYSPWQREGMVQGTSYIAYFHPEPTDHLTVADMQGRTGYQGDGFHTHVLFMDYHHDRMLKGSYRTNPEDLEGEGLSGIYLEEDRKAYIEAAIEGTWSPTLNEGAREDDDFKRCCYVPDYLMAPPVEFMKTINKIRYEPVFLAIAHLIDTKILKGMLRHTDVLPFSDVPSNDEALIRHLAIAHKKGVINGYPDGTFRPGGQVTRLEALVMTIRAMGLSGVTTGSLPYPDLDATSWYALPVELGIAFHNPNVGADAGTGIDIRRVSFFPTGQNFEAHRPITRGEVVHMLANGARLEVDGPPPTGPHQEPSFTDLEGDHPHYPWIRAAAGEGWVHGYPSSEGPVFGADQPLTRAEMAKLIVKAFFE